MLRECRYRSTALIKKFNQETTANLLWVVVYWLQNMPENYYHFINLSHTGTHACTLSHRHIRTHTHTHTHTYIYIYIYIYIYHVYPTPQLGQDKTQGQFFRWCLTGLNSELFFSYTSWLTKIEEPSLPYYLPIAIGRIIGFIPFPRVLVLCEMQSVSSRIWIRVAMSISYDDNHYTTGSYTHTHTHARIYIYIYIYIYMN